MADTYYIQVRAFGDNYRKLVEGKLVDVKGVACGLRKVVGRWELTELSTGLLVAVAYTKTEVLALARRRLGDLIEQHGSFANYMTQGWVHEDYQAKDVTDLPDLPTEIEYA